MTGAKAIVVAAIAAATPILAWGSLAMMNDEQSTDAPAQVAPLRRISVHLLCPASDITGIAIPKNILAGERPRFFQINEPSAITVTLPYGKTVTLSVKTAFINTEVDIKSKTPVVVDVDLLPLSQDTSFREAVAQLRRLLREMRIEPDERMRNEIGKWPDDNGGDFKYRTGMWLSESVGLGVEVRPSDDGKHFLVITLAVRAEARRPLWDRNFKPASK